MPRNRRLRRTAAGLAACFLAAAATAWFLRHDPIGTPDPAAATHGALRSQVPDPRPLPPDPVPSGAAPGAPPPAPAKSPIAGEGPLALPERVAALKRELKERRDPELPALSEALASRSDPSMREAALRLALECAPGDAAVRGKLAEFAAEAESAEAHQRLRALEAVMRCGRGSEIQRSGHLLFGERDHEAVAVLVRALAANPDPEAAALALDVGSRHPVEEARHRGEEERTGNFCPEHAPGPAGE